MSSSERPSDAEIRRALDEVMSLADIDEERGWPPGTAHTSLDRPHGLPNPDARVGGSRVYSGSTLQRKREQRGHWRPVAEHLAEAAEWTNDVEWRDR